MSDKFDPKRYKDEYYEKVLEVIRAKVEGVSPKLPTGKPKAPTGVIDLMEILKESLKETQKKSPRAAAEAPLPEEEEPVATGGRSRSKRTRRVG